MIAQEKLVYNVFVKAYRTIIKLLTVWKTQETQYEFYQNVWYSVWFLKQATCTWYSGVLSTNPCRVYTCRLHQYKRSRNKSVTTSLKSFKSITPLPTGVVWKPKSLNVVLSITTVTGLILIFCHTVYTSGVVQLYLSGNVSLPIRIVCNTTYRMIKYTNFE